MWKTRNIYILIMKNALSLNLAKQKNPVVKYITYYGLVKCEHLMAVKNRDEPIRRVLSFKAKSFFFQFNIGKNNKL